MMEDCDIADPTPDPFPCLTPARTPHPLHKMERDKMKGGQFCREGEPEQKS